MNRTVTLKFKNWKEHQDDIPVDKVITFYNDGQFTTNSDTDIKLPMNSDDFNKIIKVYLDNSQAEIITDQGDDKSPTV